MKVVPLNKGCFHNKHGWTQLLVIADVGVTAVGLLNELQVNACCQIQVAGNLIFSMSMKLA